MKKQDIIYIMTIAARHRDESQHAVLFCERLYKLFVLASTLRVMNENVCSYEWANTPDYERRIERVKERISELAEKVGAESVEFQGDPRGCPVSIVFDGETYKAGF
jgi:hypothetical protein